jgi:hypothetical protein
VCLQPWKEGILFLLLPNRVEEGVESGKGGRGSRDEDLRKVGALLVVVVGGGGGGNNGGVYCARDVACPLHSQAQYRWMKSVVCPEG